MTKETITLGGFGSFEDDKEGLKELQTASLRHGLELYPKYYDHELKGDATAIEALTQELWNMPRDEWNENGLYEEPII